MICYLHRTIVYKVQDTSPVIKVLIFEPWIVMGSYLIFVDKTQKDLQIKIYKGGWVQLRLPSKGVEQSQELLLKNEKGKLVTTKYTVEKI